MFLVLARQSSLANLTARGRSVGDPVGAASEDRSGVGSAGEEHRDGAGSAKEEGTKVEDETRRTNEGGKVSVRFVRFGLGFAWKEYRAEQNKEETMMDSRTRSRMTFQRTRMRTVRRPSRSGATRSARVRCSESRGFRVGLAVTEAAIQTTKNPDREQGEGKQAP